jgi:UDP-2,3-diacylglucosamine pyrophosphatase LpxH
MADAIRFRTLFLSDLHLGSRHTRTGGLLEFLEYVECERVYLVGDIVDGWALQRSPHWPEEHQRVMDWVLGQVRRGVEVVYVPGNHDEFARRFIGVAMGSLSVVRETIHETADGRRYLVTHGDEFDGIVRIAPWLSHLGARLYAILLALNGTVNRVRRAMGQDYWSLSAYLKHKTKRAVQHMADFSQVVAARGRQAKVDGVICGHIHHAESRTMDGLHYLNLGDWVESCTAAVEWPDGRLELISPVANDLRRLLDDCATPRSTEPIPQFV